MTTEEQSELATLRAREPFISELIEKLHEYDSYSTGQARAEVLAACRRLANFMLRQETR